MKRLHGTAELSLIRITDPLVALARRAGVADLLPCLHDIELRMARGEHP
jgi:hypothetical protein